MYYKCLRMYSDEREGVMDVECYCEAELCLCIARVAEDEKRLIRVLRAMAMRKSIFL